MGSWVGEDVKIEDLYFPPPNSPVDEKNFDLEKWRKESPMDYFKAIHVLQQGKGIVQDEVFKAIYRVVQLYLPDILYKYYSLTDDQVLNAKKLETLRSKRIFLSDIKDFNDPFDSKAFYYDPEILKVSHELNQCDGKLIDDFTTYIKSTSLTANDVQSMPMWAHYAGNHTGFCVSYNMKKNLELSSCTFPVQYSEERLDVTDFIKKYAKMLLEEMSRQTSLGNKQIVISDLSIIYIPLLLSNIKHVSWNYEKEYRCTMASNAPGSPYVAANPKEIFVGLKCSDKNAMKLQEIGDKLGIPVHRMEFDEISPSYKLSIT